MRPVSPFCIPVSMYLTGISVSAETLADVPKVTPSDMRSPGSPQAKELQIQCFRSAHQFQSSVI